MIVTFDDQSLKPALGELERAFKHFRQILQFRQQEMPMPVITVQAAGRRRALGWFARKAWNNGDPERVPEINISAEHLARGVHKVAGTLLHEMVHLGNYLAGVRDCSSNGYHNKRFKWLAERIGLICEKADDGRNRYGFAYTAVSGSLAEKIDEFGFRSEAFTLFRDVELERRTGGLKWEDSDQPKQVKLKKWSCGCTNLWAAVEVNAICFKPDCGRRFRRSLVLG